MKPTTLTNSHLEFSLEPDGGVWHVRSRRLKDVLVRGVRMGVTFRRGISIHRSMLDWRHSAVSPTERVETLFGPAARVSLLIGPDQYQLAYEVVFSLPQDAPFLLWKVTVRNASQSPVYLRKIDLFRVGFITISEKSQFAYQGIARNIQLHAKSGEPAFFSNGWQSWSPAGAYRYYDRFRSTRLGPFRKPISTNTGTPAPRARGHFASDMFGLLGDRLHRTGLLLGFLSQQQHFGSLEALTDPFAPALRMWANGDHARLDPGSSVETDWAYLSFLHLDTPDPLGDYLDAVARWHGIVSDSFHPPPSGWCSWYQYFQNISASIIHQNLEEAEKLKLDLPLGLFQIDDGFQHAVGDWLEFNDKFPFGVAPLAAEIKQSDFTPGLWLAPFILEPHSHIARLHPDWLLHNRRGRPVNAGFVWNTFTRALDLTHPDALAYAVDVTRTAAREWGYPYLKLDFLYAAALAGHYRQDTLTRAQVLRQGLSAIRQAVGPDTFLLACGCPLGSAIGLVDMMRIGTDVAPNWYPRQFNHQLLFKAEPDLPSTCYAIQNTLTRSPMHRRWWLNDADCLLVRPDSLLSLAEVQSLATAIAFSGSPVLLSDDLARLPPERLHVVKSLLPLIDKRPYVLDWFDQHRPSRIQLDLDGPLGPWHLLALFNWSDRPADLTLNPSDFYLDGFPEYLLREFWSGEVRRFDQNGVTWANVPAHGSLVCAVRPVRPSPLYLGSSLHISQGHEVVDWRPSSRVVSLVLSRPGASSGSIDLYLPSPPAAQFVSPFVSLPGGVYRFPVQFRGSLEMDIPLG